MRTLTIATALAVASCAHVKIAQAPQPASLPEEYILVKPGYVVSEPGFYLTMGGAVAELTASADHELEIQKQLAIMQLERDADAKQMLRDEWCSKWCLPLGFLGGTIGGTLIVEGLRALIEVAAHH